MFYCAAGHMSKSGEGMSRIPTHVRCVQTEHHSDWDNKKSLYKKIATSAGVEIVKETVFCRRHAENALKNPIVVNKDNPKKLKQFQK